MKVVVKIGDMTVAKNIRTDTPRNALSVGRVVFRIVIIFSLSELLIMAGILFIPHSLGREAEVVLDAVLLVVLATPVLYLWVIRPFVVARDEAEARVTHMAFHDPLTQLPNRRLLSEYLAKWLGSYDRHPVYGALMFIDLDDFKEVNDTFGHGAGDAVLVEVARRLESVTRVEDTISRVGGDEFVLLTPRLGSEEQQARGHALGVAEKIRELLAKPYHVYGKKLTLGSSIGIRMLSDSTVSIEELIGEADFAMYCAKRAQQQERIAFFENTEDESRQPSC
ncbi:MAG: GGDEF domain-containing protein [Pseudomonadota bacterium]|nr:MAG: GGDEF domain-containing protein [Pseudomonadota bacterium]